MRLCGNSYEIKSLRGGTKAFEHRIKFAYAESKAPMYVCCVEIERCCNNLLLHMSLVILSMKLTR